MNDKTYKTFKLIASALPLVSTFIIALGKTWGFGWADSVSATISALATFFLGLLQLESNKYFAEHDIVKTGHITFLNPELHKD